MGNWSRFTPLFAIGLLASLVLLANLTTPATVGAGVLAAILTLGAWRATRRPSQVRATDPRHPEAALGAPNGLPAIEALTRAIDAKDGRAPDHATRMGVYAAGLARAVGLPAADIGGIRLAALVRDVGKLAVPEHLLSRSEALTPEELATIRTHPVVGAELVRDLDGGFAVSAVVRSHHERWDGLGYPDGLRGGSIPIGARIVGLVEFYEALTTIRPYHEALEPDSARTLLRKEAGHAFDPDLVSRFLEVLPALTQELAAHRVGVPAAHPLDTATPSDNQPPADGYVQIARAHRELHQLYDVA